MTTVSAAVERATNEMMLNPDFGLNLQICDAINANPEFAYVFNTSCTSDTSSKEFVKAVRKRIADKNSHVQMLALTLVDTMVKNCGAPVYVEVGGKDFQKELVTIVTKERKKGTNTDVHDKVLSLIQLWSEAFAPFRAQYPLFGETYRKLRQENCNFPPRLPGEDVPVISPTQPPPSVVAHHQQLAYGNPAAAVDMYGRPIAAAPQAPQIHAQSQTQHRSHPHSHPQQHAQGQPYVQAHPQRPAASPSRMSLPEQRAKLRSDLVVVTENATLLVDMLQAVDAGEDVRQNELVQELLTTVKAMQPRLISLLASVEDDEMLAELLVRNDEVNRALDKYEQVSGERISRGPQTNTHVASTASGHPANSQPASSQPQQQGALLDFGSSSVPGSSASRAPTNAQMSPTELLMADMSLDGQASSTYQSQPSAADDDDLFNQLAKRHSSSAAGASGASAVDPFDQLANRSNARPSNSPPIASSTGSPAHGSSAAVPVGGDDQDDFDSFLNARLAKQQAQEQSSVRNVDDKQKQRMETKSDELFEL